MDPIYRVLNFNDRLFSADISYLCQMVTNFFEQLSHLYDPREAAAIVRRYTEDCGELTAEAMSRLLDGEPVQYIIGATDFYGRRFLVNPSVLIPRGETEELVRYVIEDLGTKYAGTIIDVGTGSGAIAVTLASELPLSKLTAVDISRDAINVAAKNCMINDVYLNLQELNILKSTDLSFDVVVSNPPYITGGERVFMHKNVLDYEPSLALFVPDDDPLLFYREIASRINCNKIYYEINQQFGAQVVELLESLSYVDVHIIKDLNGHDRICTARRAR